jgi:hypothetical protein
MIREASIDLNHTRFKRERDRLRREDDLADRSDNSSTSS